MTEEKSEIDILKKLKINNIAQKNRKKYYKFAIYGKTGTGKTTFATRDNNAFVIDINEDGTTVVDEGSDVAIENYQHFVYVINYLPKILEQMRSNGQQIDVVVIETIQKLRDMTLNDVMKNKVKKPTFNDWGEVAERIVSMYRLIAKMQEEYKFHFVITGHEGINKDKDDEGSTINPTITIEAQEQIKKAITSQSDVLARAMIEEFEENGVREARYVLNAEPSDRFETKIRHSPSITITNKKFVNPCISQVVQAIRNGN
ncbi:ATP-binding protein [Staphylococcus delphini]|uniref:ATP-binding protein n=1 Tax=Staphylococcus delphini TaxID=53344 RepID=A0AAQ0D5R9_9STAP|nr:ATP-binding protein [Staphylococcus delphini]QUM66204.1 ATP-binding protein [Staphylococcus delphini]QUM68640.1 ATP-binding protein [Staphylococcus delphini]